MLVPSRRWRKPTSGFDAESISAAPRTVVVATAAPAAAAAGAGVASFASVVGGRDSSALVSRGGADAAFT